MISVFQSSLRSILVQRRVYLINVITIAITYFSILYLLIGYYGDIVKISPVPTKTSLYRDKLVSSRYIPNLQYPSWLSFKYIQKYLEEYKELGKRKDKTVACQLPILQPFNPVVLNKLNEELPPLNCENERYPLIFNSTMTPFSKLFPVKSKTYIQDVLKVNSCCMRKINGYEDGLGYGEVAYGKRCLTLSLESETVVPSLWEYLVVECKFGITPGNINQTTRRIDAHSFIRHGNQEKVNLSKERPPNVLILGIDSTSRLNFRRVFPEVHDFLVEHLSAVEIKGYHKIGENTFPNVASLLTNKKPIYNGSRFDRDVHLGCEQKPDMSYDGCPFIWKDFKAEGYTTFYAEDGVGVDPFYLWRGGFEKPPTDYFLRPFMSATWALHEGPSDPLALCYGPRTGFRRLMDSLEGMASAMHKSQSPYFAFAFSGPSTHNHLNGGRYIVNDLLETLKLFYKEGYLSNTVLFVLSDHGSRVGDIRKLYQLFLEDRHPFLYVALPPGLRQKYPKAYENLKMNNENRLVTPFDVYETLVDLLPSSKFGTLMSNHSTKGFGKSLFTEIPKERSCKTAGIIKAFCTCNLVLSPLSIQNPSLVEAVKHAVGQLNYLIESNGESAKCANLSLKNSSLVSAEAVLNSRTSAVVFYRIVYETAPGNALFEAMLNFDSKREIVYEHTSNSEAVLRQGKFSGSLQRINLYKEDSWCIEDNGLKPYCYCKTPNEAAKEISNYVFSTAEGRSGYVLKFVEEYLQEAMESENAKRRERKSVACQLPIPQPYNPEIRHIFGGNVRKLNCENERYPLIFEGQLEPYPRLIPVKSLAHYRAYYGIMFCCMRKINTAAGTQGHSYGKECWPVLLEKETKVPEDWEFLVVECEFLPTSQVQENFQKTRRRVDVFSFVRVKSSKIDRDENGPKHPNVLILALGSTSRLNFRRVFPEVHSFLMRNMSAVEFKEYHKVGADTFSNIGAILANKGLTFNKFGDAGYKTFYGVDSNNMNDFNFMKPPKDVFLTEFISAAVESVGHDGFGNMTTSPKCFGPRLAFRVLMDSLEKFVDQVEKTKNSYFGFVYSDSVTRDSLTGGRRITDELLKSLKFFHGNGYLNNTVLILVSDHGIQSGDMINYFQGYMEERLPLLYFTFPKWFPREYADAYGTLKKNAEERLTTPFDVYETLVELLPSEKFWTLGKSSRITEGSLFSPIPESRNCETAGIPKEFCSCNLKLVPESTKNLILLQAANYHVKKINKLLSKIGKKRCAKLDLNYDLISTEALIDSKINKSVLHRIVFETIPGNANYEVLVNLDYEASDNQIVYEYPPLQGNAGRVNMYRDDSWCIRDKRLKPFCHCGNLHELNLKYKLDFKPYQDNSFVEQ